MYLTDLKPRNKAHAAPMAPALISQDYLRHIVESIAIPRHYLAEPENNAKVRDWIADEFRNLGLEARVMGETENVVAWYPGSDPAFKILIGAHFDSVPSSPGADDNASAVAGMIAAAKALKSRTDASMLFVAFNREEDGLLGSCEFAQSLAPQQIAAIECVHILEMIGFADDRPGTQAMPQGLPIKLDDTGDFLGVIANRHSNRHIATISAAAKERTPGLPVKALKVFLGAEKLFPHLLRSDHSPFWALNVPALMWTDTSEFRNPHYHRHSDVPETLDYAFMAQACELLVETVLRQVQEK